jgi:hypothetical protein
MALRARPGYEREGRGGDGGQRPKDAPKRMQLAVPKPADGGCRRIGLVWESAVKGERRGVAAD